MGIRKDIEFFVITAILSLVKENNRQGIENHWKSAPRLLEITRTT
jgi:hypothetical protein